MEVRRELLNPQNQAMSALVEAEGKLLMSITLAKQAGAPADDLEWLMETSRAITAIVKGCPFLERWGELCDRLEG